MTTTHVHEPVIKTRAEIVEQARDIHPLQFFGRLLLTTVLVIFTSIGWIAGRSWFTVVFSVLWSAHHLRWCAHATRYGYHKGARHEMTSPKE